MRRRRKPLSLTLDDETAGARGERGLSRGAIHCIASRDLLDGADEVIVEHNGEHYRLRHTSRGRLILTK